jgi:hypothetical protein
MALKMTEKPYSDNDGGKCKDASDCKDVGSTDVGSTDVTV